MSWLFGMGNSAEVPQIPTLPDGVQHPGQPSSGAAGVPPQQGHSKMEAYTFDSAALERAAKAAKDLEKSGYY